MLLTISHCIVLPAVPLSSSLFVNHYLSAKQSRELAETASFVHMRDLSISSEGMFRLPILEIHALTHCNLLPSIHILDPIFFISHIH